MSTEKYRSLKISLLFLCLVFALVVIGFQSALCEIYPDELTVTLMPGEVVEESKIVELPVIIPKGDIIFGFDLTGSMGGAIGIAKNEAINIMNSLDALIDDSRFGVVSYMDYPGRYSSCNYINKLYGDAFYGDYAYNLDHVLSADRTGVSSTINSLVLGYGGDGPQDYTRIMYESYADPAIEYRTGAKKILINFGDNIPHDCDINEGVPGYSYVNSTGKDPGRDEVMETSDDLDLQTVLADMAANKVTLLEIHTNSEYSGHWDYWTGITGGEHYILDYVSDIPSAIYELIQDQAISIDSLLLVVTTPGFESWLTSVTPSAYTNLLLPVDPLNFDISITVPEGTEPGIYQFYISAMGDGASYGDQLVTVTVIEKCDDIIILPNPMQMAFVNYIGPITDTVIVNDTIIHTFYLDYGDYIETVIDTFYINETMIIDLPPFQAYMYIDGFSEENPASDLDLSSIRINDTIVPIELSVVNDVPIFPEMEEVLFIKFKIREFILHYGWVYDFYDYEFAVTGNFADETPYDACGMVSIRGHISGDLNNDGMSDIVDLTLMIDYLFRNIEVANIELSGDFNHDGQISITDLTGLINYLFSK